MASSSSSWVWDSTYRLYYNRTTQQWANYVDGQWIYSSPQNGTGMTTTMIQPRYGAAGAAGGYAMNKRKYFDRDDPDAVESERPVAVPVEQIWPFDSGATVEDDRGVANGDDIWRHDLFQPTAPLLRLVVQASDVLPHDHIALIPDDEPVNIGRDKTFDQFRIRLKELQVSKTHSTIYLHRDEGQRQWSVVDLGSTHGTFVKRSDGSAKARESGQDGWTRLSPAKVASEPVSLNHLDRLRIGSTIFLIHTHSSLACDTCSVKSDQSNLIPLDHTTVEGSNSSSSIMTATPSYTSTTKETREAERRERMKGLKDRFKLTSEPTPPSATKGVTPSSTDGSKFVDRAAARRQRNESSDLSTQNRSKKKKTIESAMPFFNVPGSSSAASIISSSPALTVNPFGEESKGAQMLAKVGGSKSTNSIPSSLGTLIDPRKAEGTAGLGSRTLKPIIGTQEPLQKTGNWREDVREMNRKRWNEMQRDEDKA